MDNRRRKFLKMAGATVLAGISAPAIVKLSSSNAVASGGGQEAPAAGHGQESLADPEVQDSVMHQIEDARHLGINRTPSFIVNGMLLEGNFEPWLWKRIIELEIERAKQREGRANPGTNQDFREPLPSLND